MPNIPSTLRTKTPTLVRMENKTSTYYGTLQEIKLIQMQALTNSEILHIVCKRSNFFITLLLQNIRYGR